MTLITRKSVLRSEADPRLENTVATDVHLTELVRRGIDARNGNQRLFGMKPTYIAISAIVGGRGQVQYQTSP